MDENKRLMQRLDKLHDPKLKETLLAIGIVQQFDSGVEVLHPGQYIKLVPILLSGTIKVMKEDASGRELLLYFIRPGESCIMTLLATRGNTPSMVRAVIDEPSELLLVPSDLVKKQLAENKDWVDFSFMLFKQRYEELLYTINEIAFSSVDKRLWEILKMRSKLNLSGEVFATHQQLADELGTAREVVSRLLKKLESDGKIITSRGNIRVLADSE
ncbi:MAG: Crp/Fnr family transcriptional regulator [Saprospiraceae bacterium]